MMKDFLLSTSRYAISAHNTQPFRFAIQGDRVSVFVDPKGNLPAADPTEKDLRAALGALFEAWNISLSAKESILVLKQGPPNKAELNKAYGIFEIQNQRVDADPLMPFLEKRFSYRGSFAKNRDDKPLRSQLEKQGFKLVTELPGKKLTALLYNEINLHSMLKDGYIEELYSWMRFDEKSPRWLKDGLNSESMALSGIESWGASLLLKPSVFRFLGKLKLAGPLIDESAKIISAPYLAAIPCDQSLNDFEKGRKFLRFWLKLTQMNLFGAPLSLLTDSDEIINQLKPLFGLKGNETFVNILRVGPLPAGYEKPTPARLSGDELGV